MWHMTGGGDEPFLNFSSLALTVWEWRCTEDISTNDDLISQSVNEWQKCLLNSPIYTGSVKEQGRKPKPKENPINSETFTQIFILFLIGFCIGPSKIRRRFHIGLPKIHRRILIGPPKMHRQSSGFPQSSPTRIPQTGNYVDPCYFERKPAR